MTDPSQLLAAAVAARARAYAPYSAFAVGAALLGSDGRIWSGVNVENASYGLSMCAERSAIFHAVTGGVREFDAIAVAGPDGITTLPCGACRQVLHEFAPRLRVIYADHDDAGSLVETPLEHLLPHAFGPTSLAAAQGTDSPHRSEAQPGRGTDILDRSEAQGSRGTDSLYRSGAKRSRGTDI